MKEFASILAVVVSVFSLYLSNEARKANLSLDETSFSTETTVRLLQEVHSNMAHDASLTPDRKRANCLYAGQLALAEENAVPEGKTLVRDLFLQLASGEFIDESCKFRIIEELDVEPANVTVSDSASFEIGQNHALISSYRTTEASCERAIDDVKEFATLLAGKGIDGRVIYVARTSKSDNYAVTVDAGDDAALARQASSLIRQVSSEAFGNTGSDSFTQINRDWYIDSNCDLKATIGG